MKQRRVWMGWVIGGLVAAANLPVIAHAAEMTTTVKASAQTGVSKPAVKYVGNAESKIYHKAACQFVKNLKQNQKANFASAADAKKAGYTACKVCFPQKSTTSAAN